VGEEENSAPLAVLPVWPAEAGCEELGYLRMDIYSGLVVGVYDGRQAGREPSEKRPQPFIWASDFCVEFKLGPSTVRAAVDA